MPGSSVAGHYSTSGTTVRSSRGTTRPAGQRDATRPAGTLTSADRAADKRNSPSADRVADEERGGVSRSGEGLWGLGRGLDTCPARSSRGTTRPAEQRFVPRGALLDQRNYGALLDQRNNAGHYSTSGTTRGTTRPAKTHTPADRVADEDLSWLLDNAEVSRREGISESADSQLVGNNDLLVLADAILALGQLP